MQVRGDGNTQSHMITDRSQVQGCLIWHLVSWPPTKLEPNWGLYIVSVTAFSSETKTKNKKHNKNNKVYRQIFFPTLFF